MVCRVRVDSCCDFSKDIPTYVCDEIWMDNFDAEPTTERHTSESNQFM